MKSILQVFRLGDAASWPVLSGQLAGRFRVEEDSPRRTETTCLDTFDLRLRKAGLGLTELRRGRERSLRLSDDKATPPLVVAKPFGGGFAADLPNDRFRDRLAKIIEMRRLLPLVRLNGHSRRIVLRNRDGKIVLRLASEDITAQRLDGGGAAGDAVVLGAWLSLQPLRGYDKEAAAVADLLSSQDGVESAVVPPHEAAFDLLGIGDDAHLADDPRLDGQMTAGQASRRIHMSLLLAMERNEAGTRADLDSEFLHDFRVAVRRTRSALGQIDKGVLPDDRVAWAKGEFRWLGGQTGPKRDLDVYLLAYPELESLLPDPYRPHLRPFHDHLASRGKVEGRKLSRALASKRYSQIREIWHGWLETSQAAPQDGPWALTPVHLLADSRIWKAYRRLLREGGAITDESPPQALHDLRIRAKKLRYLLEFFRTLYAPAEITRLIKVLKGLQTVLGDYQDAEVQSQAILHFGREMADAGVAPVETQMAMGMVAESILLRQDQARQGFDHSFRAFAAPAIDKLCRQMFRNQEKG